MLYGDNYDGMIEVAILNHWYRVFTTGAAWDVTGYFYPYASTLGYNDTYVVPGIPFSLARIAGADPFLAACASHVAMKSIGFVGMYVLLRRGLNVRTLLALSGAVLFTTANVSLLHMYHAQLLSVGLFPWLSFLAVRTARMLHRDRSYAVFAYGCGFAVLYGVTALNAFYGVWFFSLFLAIYAPVALMLMPANERQAFGAAAMRHWRALLACLVVGAIALLPMLLLYLPIMATGARHSWESGPHLYLPNMLTLFNVGSGNLVWGRLPTLLGADAPFPGGETRFGLPIGLMVATLFALLWAGRERAKSGIMLPVGIALGVVTVLALRWPPDHSAWWYIYSYVPGASAVRVVSRFLLFALVGIIPIVIVFLDRTPRRGWVLTLILAGLLVEEVQLDAPLTLDRHAQLRMLAAVGPPPAQCSAFFVVSARSADFPVLAESRAIDRAWGGDGIGTGGWSYRPNVDAMVLASYYGRPTINGISSFNPPDWTFANPQAADYLDHVRSYAMRHRLHGLCGLDVRRAVSWFPLAHGA
ncbi:hypothetical protein EAH84_13645 [Sphingomonas oligophenolica]|uniref:Glycosyltransferase RgtA/B/C/D-like domain-containing protein n=2 Tax=Sphingomonas oligophenolica TaxID=301154 RepID=A0A502CD01_9SPHN|nr:hypothetical protein EAH84_13645 [Sphingomonas oligophenolica]